MAVSIEHYEKAIKVMVETLLTTRPVFYANERKPQSTEPYVVIAPLPSVLAGLPYETYTNLPEPEKDVEQQLVRPIELTVSITFIGGNARGELSLLLAGFRDEDVKNYLRTNGLGYLRDSGTLDLSESLGGDFEQRAQSDIVFGCCILPDKKVVTTVESLNISGFQKDSALNEIIDTEIKVDINS